MKVTGDKVTVLFLLQTFFDSAHKTRLFSALSDIVPGKRFLAGFVLHDLLSLSVENHYVLAKTFFFK